MRQMFILGALALTTLAMTSCATIPGFAGDPNKHGFVIIEGEVVITKLVSVEHPFDVIHGKRGSGLTWFSELEPGTYRVKDLLPRDAPEPVLSFTIGAGELRYLGYIVATPLNGQADAKRNANIPKEPRFNIVHNRDELRAWEYVYNFYASTPWEALLLKKIETVQKSGSN
jgi:hypothetical protein